jgi:hypothetical protein
MEEEWKEIAVPHLGPNSILRYYTVQVAEYCIAYLLKNAIYLSNILNSQIAHELES